MKRNVDLTWNRFFSSNNWLNDSAIGVLTFSGITVEKFPWNAYIKEIKSNDEFDLEHQRKSIIAVGNKAMRAKVKKYRQMNSFDYCDCCGVRMNLKPWDGEIGICHKCNNYYEKDVDKCKWRKGEVSGDIKYWISQK